MKPVIEMGTIEHDGRTYSALGSVIDPDSGVIVGYARHGNFNGIPHQLCSWSGEPIAALEITGSAMGFNRTTLTCYAMNYKGRRYYGRGLGNHMVVRLRCKPGPYVPRPGRQVTAGDLRRLQTSQETHQLYCRKCQATYSADPSDYFTARDSAVFKCCGVNNWLLAR